MTSSNDFYHSAINQDQFNDSIVIQPISLKPTVIPTFLNKNICQNTILSTYDAIKLTQFIENSQIGKIIQLVHIDSNSLITHLTQEGILLLQKFSGSQIAFITIFGQKSSGKSFLIDKILNLSNIPGNKFCLSNQRPGLYVWSTPFIKDDLNIFIVELANCSTESKEFEKLFNYTNFLSSIIISLQQFNEKKNNLQLISNLDKKLSLYARKFKRNQKSSVNKNRLVSTIMPQKIISLKRKKQQILSKVQILQNSQVQVEQFYLPNAKNLQYRGIDQDLKSHSFLNKKCINEEYIKRVSQLFLRIYQLCQQKKQKQLVFNGSILLKYVRKLQHLFNKNIEINLDQTYYDIVKDLYVSAYNYCVITYHELLEQKLSDQRPRSLDQLLDIFSMASNQIFQKYNQFSLQKDLHEQYQLKLINHIESKQKLILQINKKKANLQLSNLYDNQLNLKNMNTIWQQIQTINKQNSQYQHDQHQILGKKLIKLLPNFNSKNSEQIKIKKKLQELNKIKQQSIIKLNELKKQNNLKKQKIKYINQDNKRKYKQSQIKTKQLDDQIQKLNNQIKHYQKTKQLNTSQLQQVKEKYQQTKSKNQQILFKLKQQQKQPIQKDKNIIAVQNQIDNVLKKQENIKNTLTSLTQQENNQNNNQKKSTKIIKQQLQKQKESNSNLKKSTQNKPMKQSKTSKQNKSLNQSKNKKN